MALTHAQKLEAIRHEREEVDLATAHLIKTLNMHREVCDEQGCAIERRLMFLLDTASGMKHTYEAAERRWS